MIAAFVPVGHKTLTEECVRKPSSEYLMSLFRKLLGKKKIKMSQILNVILKSRHTTQW